MRYQLALLAVLPLGESVFTAIRRGGADSRRMVFAQAGRLVLAGSAAMLVFVPQMIAWNAIYGHCLVSPLILAHSWLHPDFGRILFSSDRGYFYWTPMTIAMLGGMIAALVFKKKGIAAEPALPLSDFHQFDFAASERDEFWSQRKQRASSAAARQRETLTCLLVAFAAQVYLLASVTGDGVFLGTAFGYRHLTEATVLLVPGLAWLLQSSGTRSRGVWLAMGATLCVWNVLLMAQYHREILPRQAGADLSALWESCMKLESAWPQGMLLFLAGPVLISMTLLLWRHQPAKQDAVDAILHRFEFLEKRRTARRERRARVKKKSVAKTPR
jgi:hypothetical protein